MVIELLINVDPDPIVKGMTNLHNHLDLLDRLPSPDERRSIRQRLNLTQRQIGDHVGVTSAAVATWESGQTPSPEHLARYIELLDELTRRAESPGATE